MTPRRLADVLLRAGAQYPVVTLTGPRQSGKTTLLRSAFPAHRYVSIEAPDERSFAIEDPRGFLARFKEPTILDEVQHVPDLFSYIQPLVDEAGGTGHFILSGSSNFLLMERVSQTLAGRARIAHLMPFALNELRCSTDWLECARRGFYPRIHDLSLDASEWLAQYYQTYLQRDVRDITRIGDLERFSRFVMLCAGRTGQLLNLASLGNDCGIAQDTARRWLSVLEASFVVFRLPPYHRRYNRRLTRSPKLYFVDTGLLCWLLGIRTAEELASHAYRGAVFETLVIADRLKTGYHAGELPRLYFWRDHRGNEVDLVIDTPSGPHAIEIKSGATVNADFFKGLRYWRNLVGADAPATLVYGGGESYERDGVAVRGWAAARALP